MRETKYIGICGWLSPDGTFVSSPYGKHGEIAALLEYAGIVKSTVDSVSGQLAHGERLLELLGYIKFTCCNETESYVFFPQQFGYRKDITNKQIDFLIDNNNRMTNLQKRYVQQYLHYAYRITM